MPNLSLLPTQSLVSPERTGAGSGGPGTNAIVGGVLGAAGEAAHIYQQHQDDQARVWAGNALSSFHLQQQQSLLAQRDAAAKAVSDGSSVPDMTGDYLKTFDDEAQKLIATAPNGQSKRYLNAQIGGAREALGSQMIGQQATLTRQWKVSSFDTSASNAGRIVMQDPTQYDAQMGNLASTMPSVDPETDSQRLLAAKATLANAAASSTLDRDPYTLKALTGKAMGEGGFKGATGAAWVDSATPEQVKTWNSLADAKIRMLESRRKSDQDAAEAAALKTYNELVTFTNSGKVPDLDYIGRVKAETAGTTQEASATALLQVAVSGGGFGAMTLPRQQATLTALEANGNAAGSDPQREATLQQFRTIHATQKKAYADNPWQAGTEYAHLPAQPEQQVQSPEQGVTIIAQRRPLMSRVESASGATLEHTGISPLQPNEAAAWAQTLSTLPVSARAEVLGTAGSLLTAPQIDALAEQLGAKDKATALMLKINDRTASGRTVAERVGIGAQAIADGTVKADDTKLAGWKAEAATALRGALGNTKAEDDAILAAYYVRAAAELPSGTTPGYESPQKSVEAAIAMVVGQPMNRGGINTILPHGMTESAFDTKLRSFTPEMLKTMAPDGQVYLRDAGGVRSIPLNLLHGRMVDFGMKYFSPGVYAPVRNNVIITTDKDGTKPLLLKVQ
jgi:hypothetical protein